MSQWARWRRGDHVLQALRRRRVTHSGRAEREALELQQAAWEREQAVNDYFLCIGYHRWLDQASEPPPCSMAVARRARSASNSTTALSWGSCPSSATRRASLIDSLYPRREIHGMRFNQFTL